MTGLNEDVSPAVALSKRATGQAVTTPMKKTRKSFKTQEDELSTSASSGSSSEGEEVSSDDSPVAARTAAKGEDTKKAQFGRSERHWFFSFLSCARRSSAVPAPTSTPATSAALANGTTHRRPAAAPKPQQSRKPQNVVSTAEEVVTHDVPPETPSANTMKETKAAAPAVAAAEAPSIDTPQRSILVLPPGFRAPPGLDSPPGLEFLDKYPSVFQDVTFKEWQLTSKAAQKPQKPTPKPQPVQPVAPSQPAVFTPKERIGEFNQAAFRRELVQILDGLFYDNNTARAVQCVRAQKVPEAVQDIEFEDILTRAVETANGTVRRKMIAFAVGLAAGKPGAFSRSQCTKGVGTFLSEVCPEMRDEIPKLTSILCSEVIPTLRSVFTPAELDHHLPAFMKDCVRRADAQLRHRQR